MPRHRERGERGVSAVEFGLILPVLLVLLLGMLDYGYVYFVQLTLTNAAREGARVGVTRSSGTASAAAQAAANAYLTTAGITTAAVSATTPSNGTPTVTVTVTLNPFNPLVGFVPAPPQLQATTSMRWELSP